MIKGDNMTSLTQTPNFQVLKIIWVRPNII